MGHHSSGGPLVRARAVGDQLKPRWLHPPAARMLPPLRRKKALTLTAGFEPARQFAIASLAACEDETPRGLFECDSLTARTHQPAVKSFATRTPRLVARVCHNRMLVLGTPPPRSLSQRVGVNGDALYAYVCQRHIAGVCRRLKGRHAE